MTITTTLEAPSPLPLNLHLPFGQVSHQTPQHASRDALSSTTCISCPSPRLACLGCDSTPLFMLGGLGDDRAKWQGEGLFETATKTIRAGALRLMTITPPSQPGVLI